MKVKIIDKDHIMLVASNTEVSRYSGHAFVFIDTQSSFIDISGPSSSAISFSRSDNDTLLNVELDIGSKGLTTDEFLIVYLQLDDLTIPVVIPCYNNCQLILTVANKVGILDDECDCKKDCNKAYPIVLYYGFKLALSISDIRTAVRYWNRICDTNTVTSTCNCNGR